MPQVYILPLLFLVAVLFAGTGAIVSYCRTPEDVQHKLEIAELVRQKTQAETELVHAQTNLGVVTAQVQNKNRELLAASGRVNELNQEEKVVRTIAEGGSVRYILNVTLKQSNFTLSIKKHMSNAMNAETFDIVVDKIAYDNANAGDDLMKAFRTGSFLMNGSLGNWKITVNSKRMVTLPGVEK